MTGLSTFALITIVAVVVALVVAVALWAYFTAQRLNRLHIRVDASLAALQSALERRGAVIAVLCPQLQAQASRAERLALSEGRFAERSAAEKELTQAAAGLLAEPSAHLVEAETRVELAHRFYNEAVADTRALRLRPAVKALRLGGTARLPEFFELTAGLGA